MITDARTREKEKKHEKGEESMALLIIGVCALTLWVMYLIANEFYKVAQDKGYSNKKYLWISFWLGIIGYLLVIALPDRRKTAQSVADELPDL